MNSSDLIQNKLGEGLQWRMERVTRTSALSVVFTEKESRMESRACRFYDSVLSSLFGHPACSVHRAVKHSRLF